MAQKNDEIEKQKLVNERLTTKKLQQETHWLKTWLLPIVQFLSAGLLVLVTYLIGSNTNLLKSQEKKK